MHPDFHQCQRCCLLNRVAQAVHLTDHDDEAVTFMMGYDTLTEMGYQKEQIEEALLISKNDANKAIDYLSGSKH